MSNPSKHPAELARAVAREVLADNRTAFISDLADMVHHGMTYKNSLTKIIEAALEAHGQAERERALEEASTAIGKLFHENVNMRSPDWPLCAAISNDVQAAIRALKQRNPKP